MRSGRTPDGVLKDVLAESARRPNVAPVSSRQLREAPREELPEQDSLLPPSLGELGHPEGPGSLTRPASDGSAGARSTAAPDTPQECRICHKTWLGGPRCPEEATHAHSKAARQSHSA